MFGSPSMLTEFSGICFSAVAGVLFGALFYSRFMFLPLWTKYSQRPASKGPSFELMIKAFMINFISALVLAKLIGIPASFAGAITRGLVTGGGIAGTAIAHNYLFTGADPALFFVDILFNVLQHGVMAGTLYCFRSMYLFAK